MKTYSMSAYSMSIYSMSTYSMSTYSMSVDKYNFYVWKMSGIAEKISS